MPTPVKIDLILAFLDTYDENETGFLRDGFKKGFRIKYRGKCKSKIHTNHKSAMQNPKAIKEYLEKNVAMNRIAGPYDTPPYDEFMCNPMAAVPKTTEGEMRILTNMSYPEGESVNDGIDREFCTVKYATFQDVISFIKSCKKKPVFLAKTDIKTAFRIIPISPEDYHLLLLAWENKIYIDRVMPMGLSQSCNIFERFSRALEHIGLTKLKADHITHLLDDFLFAATTYEKCKMDLDHFIEFCTRVGVPIAPNKTVGPATSITFLGITLDTIKGQSRLPEEKVEKCKNCLSELLNKKKVTLEQLQSLIGYLNFCCCVVLPGRTFLRRLIDATRGLKKAYHHVRINAGMRADMIMWLDFVKSYNGASFFRDDQWITNKSLVLYTDSSKLGYGAVYGKKWMYGGWPCSWKHYHITVLEFYPILAALYTWGHEWENKNLLFYSDNIAVVAILNKQSSREPNIMTLLRLLVLRCLSLNIEFQSCHVPGKQNALPDSLSRFQLEAFRQLAPWADDESTEVPREILPQTLGLLAKN